MSGRTRTDRPEGRPDQGTTVGEVTLDPSVEERQVEPSTSTSTTGSDGDRDLDTECHLWALTHRLDDGLVVPIVAVPKGQASVIATASWDRIGPAIDVVRSHRDRCDIYVGIYAIEKARMKRIISEGRRGTQSEVDAVVAVIADVDIAGPNHRAEKDYPRDVEEAQAVVSGVGVDPMLLLHTGGGLAAWWILECPIIFDDADHRKAIRSEVLDLFANGIDRAASQIGREVDHLADPVRVMRLAGTVNYKHGGSDPVQMMSWNPDIVLTNNELADACREVEPEVPPRSTPTTERPTNRLAALTDGPNILTHAIDPLPWSAIWPAGWTRRKDGVVGGVTVERWQRPGSSHDHSAVCWPDGGCTVHSDAVSGLPAGKYSKAKVVAALAGISVSDLARDLWRRGAA